jgi:K+-transporting ATPase, c chain
LTEHAVPAPQAPAAPPTETRPPKVRTRPTTSLFEPSILRRAAGEAFIKLDPRTMIRIPVMFVVEIGSVITSVEFVSHPDVSSGWSHCGCGPPCCSPTSPRRWPKAGARPRLPVGASVPVDAVTASGSGLDPDISVQNALDQAPRVARARHLPASQVIALVHRYTQDRQWGFLGERAVNVLKLNLALDGLAGGTS